MRKKILSGIGAVASGVALTAASVFGMAATAQADYLSPEQLSSDVENGWFASNDYEGEISPELQFDECAVVFDEFGGYVGYHFPDDAQPTNRDAVSALLLSFSASVTTGGGTLGVLIDVEPTGIADPYLEIPVGAHGFSLASQVFLDDNPSLGLSDEPTVQQVLDALDATGEDYNVIELFFEANTAAAVQWLAFGGETYWFGTDAEWFTTDPSCGTIKPEPTPEPQPEPQPTPDVTPKPTPAVAPKAPARVDTGV